MTTYLQETVMHELSIASSITDTVLKEVDKRCLSSVHSITLRIGVLTAIEPAALMFGFEAMTKGTLLENTKLKIESIPISGTCQTCKNEFEIQRFVFICPVCSSNDIKTVRGNELEITSIEVED